MIARRHLIFSLLASGLVSSCLPSMGLMRLGMRGAAIRGGARAARAGPKGNLHTLGRAGAATLQIARLHRPMQATRALSRFGDIFGVENNEQAVCVDANEQRAECSVDGTIVCSTHRAGRSEFFEHISALYGSCGTSRATTETEIRHFDSKGDFVGADILEGSVIRHVGSDGQVVGYTRMQITRQDSGEGIAVVDSKGFLNEQMIQLENAHRDELGVQGARELETIANAQANCIERNPSESCRDLQAPAYDALTRLEARFRAFS